VFIYQRVVKKTKKGIVLFETPAGSFPNPGKLQREQFLYVVPVEGLHEFAFFFERGGDDALLALLHLQDLFLNRVFGDELDAVDGVFLADQMIASFLAGAKYKEAEAEKLVEAANDCYRYFSHASKNNLLPEGAVKAMTLICEALAEYEGTK